MGEKKAIGNISIWIGVASAIISLTTIIVGLFFWFDSKIEEVVLKKFVKTENFWTAKRLLAEKEYDEAIPIFEKAFIQFEIDGMSRKKLGEIIDPFLSAIANSDNINEHGPRFELIFPHIGKKISVTPNRHYLLGLYFLKTGKLIKAKNEIGQAIIYCEEEDKNELADYYWIRIMVYIAQKNLQGALDATIEREKIDPNKYGLEIVELGKQETENTKLNKRLKIIYVEAKFENNLEKWFTAIEDELTQRREKSESTVEAPYPEEPRHY